MEFTLDDIEIRVLGCLIEKETTTPDNYPLTLNALTAACNQKTNRDPVLNLTEGRVVRALDSLREKNLVWENSPAGSRVPKYSHQFGDVYGVDVPEMAALCVMMLRGPQTVGEIKTRAARQHDFADLEAVEAALQRLMERTPDGLIARMARQAGRKEPRYAHLLTGDLPVAPPVAGPPPETARVIVEREEKQRLEMLAEIAALREELDALKVEFETFKAQF